MISRESSLSKLWYLSRKSGLPKMWYLSRKSRLPKTYNNQEDQVFLNYEIYSENLLFLTVWYIPLGCSLPKLWFLHRKCNFSYLIRCNNVWYLSRRFISVCINCIIHTQRIFVILNYNIYSVFVFLNYMISIKKIACLNCMILQPKLYDICTEEKCFLNCI